MRRFVPDDKHRVMIQIDKHVQADAQRVAHHKTHTYADGCGKGALKALAQTQKLAQLRGGSTQLPQFLFHEFALFLEALEELWVSTCSMCNNAAFCGIIPNINGYQWMLHNMYDGPSPKTAH